MKDCPLKWPEKSFKENNNFSLKKDSRFSPRIIRKSALKNFSFDKYQLKNRVENSVSAIQHIGNRKSNTEVLPPPHTHLVTKLILLHTVVVLHYTHHIRWHDWSEGRRLSKCSKTIYYKSSLVTNFLQTCSLISI